jgi:hypothetical protein
LRDARRRRIERQLERIANAGRGEIEREWREVAAGDLRRRAGQEVRRLVLGPEAIAHTRAEPAGTAAALIRGRTGDADRLEARHSGSRREARKP